MTKSNGDSDDRKLMDRLLPDPALGPLLGICGTTYNIDLEFFEKDFLPTLLGLGAWDDRHWSSRIALEKHLAELDAATLLMDAGPYQGRPRSLRVEVEPVPLGAGRILHAKVFIAVYEQAIRLVVGSANLTEPGYRRNREAVAVLTASERQPGDAKLIAEGIEGLQDLLGDWLTRGARELLQRALQLLEPWRNAANSQEDWFCWSGGKQPLWRQFLARWPDQEELQRITIVSPFWSEERHQGPVTTLIQTLRESKSLTPFPKLRLWTEAAPDTQTAYRPSLPGSFASFDGTQLGLVAHAVAVDPRVPPDETGLGEEHSVIRALHAKLLLFEGSETSLLYVGSANFTRSGWGFGPAAHSGNIEAGLILKRTGPVRQRLESLLPRTIGSPVPLEGAAEGAIAIAEESPAESPWPAFLHDVLLAQSKPDADALELVVRLNKAAEGSWKLTHVPAEDSADHVLLAIESPETDQCEYRVSLTPVQLNRLLQEQEVLVSWWSCPGGRSFPINVSQAARPALPISPGTGRPEEQQLIAYYQGRITWTDLFPDPDDPGGNKTPGSGDDDSNGVDTSRIQSYIVREFVEALQGIRDDLRSAAQATPASMRLALLGPVSPVALARRVTEAAHQGERTATAAGFQLVELLGCLRAAQHMDVAPRFQPDWQQIVEEAVSIVAGQLTKLEERYAAELSGEFRRYARAVEQHQVKQRSRA